MAVGEHARAGALRYFARGDLSGEPEGEAVLRRYLEASLVSVSGYRRLLHEKTASMSRSSITASTSRRVRSARSAASSACVS